MTLYLSASTSGNRSVGIVACRYSYHFCSTLPRAYGGVAGVVAAVPGGPGDAAFAPSEAGWTGVSEGIIPSTIATLHEPVSSSFGQAW